MFLVSRQQAELKRNKYPMMFLPLHNFGLNNQKLQIQVYRKTSGKGALKHVRSDKFSDFSELTWNSQII